MKLMKKIGAVIEGTQQHLPGPLYRLWQNYVPDLTCQYVSLGEKMRRYLQHRKRTYTIYTEAALKKQKKSDTLFIFGCNSSVNDISDADWARFKQHDTLGFNYWIYHRFVPDFYLLEYGTNKVVDQHHVQLIQRRANDYQQTIFLVHTRARRRGMRPHLMPEFFPNRARVGYFLSSKVLCCPSCRPFVASDFKKSIYYRGTLNFSLYFGRLMGYKKIVLVGCEMDNGIPFYEYYPEAQWMHTIPGYQRPREERLNRKYEGAYPSKEKHSFIDTILAINEYVFKPEGIQLYTFSVKSLLFPQVPIFTFIGEKERVA